MDHSVSTLQVELNISLTSNNFISKIKNIVESCRNSFSEKNFTYSQECWLLVKKLWVLYFHRMSNHLRILMNAHFMSSLPSINFNELGLLFEIRSIDNCNFLHETGICSGTSIQCNCSLEMFEYIK